MQPQQDNTMPRTFGPMPTASTPSQTPPTFQTPPSQPQPQESQAVLSAEDRIVAKILAALGGQAIPQPTMMATPQPLLPPSTIAVPQQPLQPLSATPQALQPLSTVSSEDQRFIAALAGIHTSGKDVSISFRDAIAPHLSLVMYAFTPAAGARREVTALVYDNGQMTHVFTGGR